MSSDKKVREYNITVSYDISKLDENTRQSLEKKLVTIDKSLDESVLTWQGFNTFVGSPQIDTTKTTDTTNNNMVDLVVKCPKKHLEFDKLLCKTHSINPSVYKTSNSVSYPLERPFLVHVLDINYTINVTVTECEADFCNKELNSNFSKLQKDALKIISDLDNVNFSKEEYSPTVERMDNIEFVSHCVNAFETIKDFVRTSSKMSDKTKSKMKEMKDISILMNIDVNTTIRFLQKC